MIVELPDVYDKGKIEQVLNDALRKIRPDTAVKLTEDTTNDERPRQTMQDGVLHFYTDEDGVRHLRFKNQGKVHKTPVLGAPDAGWTTFTNLSTDKTCDANSTTVAELADILGTLIEALKTKKILSA